MASPFLGHHATKSRKMTTGSQQIFAAAGVEPAFPRPYRPWRLRPKHQRRIGSKRGLGSADAARPCFIGERRNGKQICLDRAVFHSTKCAQDCPNATHRHRVRRAARPAAASPDRGRGRQGKTASTSRNGSSVRTADGFCVSISRRRQSEAPRTPALPVDFKAWKAEAAKLLSQHDISAAAIPERSGAGPSGGVVRGGRTRAALGTFCLVTQAARVTPD